MTCCIMWYYAESDHEKANLLNTYYSSQAVVDDTNTQLPPIPDIDHSLEFIKHRLHLGW